MLPVLKKINLSSVTMVERWRLTSLLISQLCKFIESEHFKKGRAAKKKKKEMLRSCHKQNYSKFSSWLSINGCIPIWQRNYILGTNKQKISGITRHSVWDNIRHGIKNMVHGREYEIIGELILYTWVGSKILHLLSDLWSEVYYSIKHHV